MHYIERGKFLGTSNTKDVYQIRSELAFALFKVHPYCWFTEKALGQGYALFHSTKGVLVLEPPEGELTPPVDDSPKDLWPNLFLVSPDLATQLTNFSHKAESLLWPDNKDTGTIDQTEEGVDLMEEDDEISRGIFSKTYPFQFSKRYPRLRLPEEREEFFQLPISLSMPYFIFIEPNEQHAKQEVKQKARETIKAFKLNGPYYDYEEEDWTSPVIKVPIAEEEVGFGDFLLRLRYKAYENAQDAIAQIQLMNRFGEMDNLPMILEQHAVLKRMTGFFSTWNHVFMEELQSTPNSNASENMKALISHESFIRRLGEERSMKKLKIEQKTIVYDSNSRLTLFDIGIKHKDPEIIKTSTDFIYEKVPGSVKSDQKRTFFLAFEDEYEKSQDSKKQKIHDPLAELFKNFDKWLENFAKNLMYSPTEVTSLTARRLRKTYRRKKINLNTEFDSYKEKAQFIQSNELFVNTDETAPYVVILMEERQRLLEQMQLEGIVNLKPDEE